MRDLLVTRAAQADLLEIWMYLYQRSERAADRVVDEITDKCGALLAFPFVGRCRPEIGGAYRSLTVGDYVVFYRVSDSTVEISRVLHGARDIAGIFTSDE